MGDHQRRHLLLTDDAIDILRHRQTGLIIQGGKSLVQQENVRRHRQGANQRHPLAHTAAKLGGVAIGKLRQPIGFQQAVGVCPRFGGEAVANLQAKQHVLPHGAPFQQIILLQHIADMGAGTGHRLTRHHHPPRRRGQRAGDDRKQGGFATAAGTHQAVKIPLFHRKRDILQRHRFPLWGLIGLANPLHTEHRHICHPFCPISVSCYHYMRITDDGAVTNP